MSNYDIVIKGGTVIDGLRTPRYKADVGIKDGRIATIGAIDASDGAEVVDASGKIVAPGLRRPAHPLRQPGVLGPVVHHVGLARRDQRRDRQLRVRVRAVQARRPGPGDAVGVAQRGGAAQDDAGGHAVGLGDVPGVPRQRRPDAQRASTSCRWCRWPRCTPTSSASTRPRSSGRRDEELEKMCQLLVEAMEAGGCGWSSQISGDIGNIQRDYDGTPMVTDLMTERELIAFSRALRTVGRGTTQITGPLDDRRAHRPGEWPADHLERAGSRPARSTSTASSRYPHREAIQRLRQLNEEEGVRVFAPGQHRPLPLGDQLRGVQPHGHLPRVAGGVPRHDRGEDRQVRRPRAAREAERSASNRWAAVSASARYPIDEITVNWISSDAPDAQQIKERYEGFTLGEIAARESKSFSTPCSTSPWPPELKRRFRHHHGRHGPRRP